MAKTIEEAALDAQHAISGTTIFYLMLAYKYGSRDGIISAREYIAKALASIDAALEPVAEVETGDAGASTELQEAGE